nr:hypothetical protein [Ignavibacteria bacterium]
NRWYHVAAIARDTIVFPYDFVKVRELYIDGIVVARDWVEFESATLGSSTDSLFIGGFGAPNYTQAIIGSIDDLRIWNGKYYPDDVVRNYRTPLAGWGNSNNYYYKCILSISG